jgi:hypothetical protein
MVREIREASDRKVTGTENKIIRIEELTEKANRKNPTKTVLFLRLPKSQSECGPG